MTNILKQLIEINDLRLQQIGNSIVSYIPLVEVFHQAAVVDV